MKPRDRLRAKRDRLGNELQALIDRMPAAEGRAAKLRKLMMVGVVVREALALLTPLQRELMLRELLNEELRK